MARCNLEHIFLVVSIVCFSLASAELIRPPQPPQYNYAFNKFRPPPPPEPTFFQRVTSWFFPWGGVTSEEEFRVPASPKIDSLASNQRPQYHSPPVARINPVPVRDTEPTTARTTPGPPITKCSPCNKVPWIPMVPTYQQPAVNSGGQHQQQNQQQLYFKHHFENEGQYAQVPSAPNYGPPSAHPSYGPPSSAQPPSTTPIKYQDGSNVVVGRPYYGSPPVKFQNYQQAAAGTKVTTYKPNTNTIDSSVITFTTLRPTNNFNRPLRFTAASSITNPEYLPPPNVLPLESENSQYAPIPIPNLSPTPIPPLFDAKPFHDDPYRSQSTGFIKLVPLEPVAQVSNNVNVQVKPERNLPEFEAVNESPTVEVISSNLVAEFSLPAEKAQKEISRPASQSNFHLDLDVGNNLDANTTVHSPIVVDSLETATDNVGAGSEHNYEHNVHQALEAASNHFRNPQNSEPNLAVPTRDAFNSPNDSDEVTTTEGNYVIQFEPSLQTAADLAAKSTKKAEPTKKTRPTPLELLDSPILHVTPFTLKPKKSTPAPPAFKPLEDYTKTLATLWTSPVPISTSTEPTPTPTYPTRETSPTTSSVVPTAVPTTVSFLSKLSSGTAFLGITPPREPERPPPPTKTPKQIQIVIPYTTFNKPSPFKIKEEQELITYRPIRGHYVTHPTKKSERIEKNQKIEETFNGHGYHNDQEYPDHGQESKIVESKVTVEPFRTTKYLTKILANNIRDLLKKEKTPKPPKIDLMKLQKNIDGWTEQSFLGKVSTISLTGHTKAIPRAFLSTKMMKKTTVMQLPTTTLSPKSTFDPDLMEETKRQYDNILYKKDDEAIYVKRHDRFLNRDNELVLLNNNLTYNSVQEGVKVFAPKTTLTPKELWKRLHVTISPLTNEKIYVVTPQPRQEAKLYEASTFRPRFSIRPTVASKMFSN